MKKFILKLVRYLFSFFAFLILISSVITPITYGTSESSLDEFMESPSILSWKNFQEDCQSRCNTTCGEIFRKVIEYHDDRQKRDMPNSMVIKNMTPDEFVSVENERVNNALNFIRKNQSTYFWKLIKKMAVQEFDDELMWTACEIAARLSPKQFDFIVAEVTKYYPDRLWIIDRNKERWILSSKIEGQ